jgi:hypothetical protein
MKSWIINIFEVALLVMRQYYQYIKYKLSLTNYSMVSTLLLIDF